MLYGYSWLCSQNERIQRSGCRQDEPPCRKNGLTFEEKAFYDILMALRDKLKFDIKVCLVKNGYPPQYSPEVFQKVMEQVENFEENN